MAGLYVDCCAGRCADGTYAASTITFYPITQQNLCTHLRLFVVATGQALEQGAVGLHIYCWLVDGLDWQSMMRWQNFLELEW